jgi:hypothetical protein
VTTLTPARQRWLIPTLIVLLSLTIGGGLLAREWYRPVAAALPAGENVVVPAPVTTSLSPAEQPGSDVVGLTPDAAAHPQSKAVVALLQSYFTAINKKDYRLWTLAVSTERRQSKTEAEWQSDYRSTRDGSILAYRIESAALNQLRVLVAFTSTQDERDAPVGLPEHCIRWRLTLPVIVQGGGLRVDVTTTNAPERGKC